MNELAEGDRNRFVRARCPICDEVSPVCDQREDVRRDALGDWWFAHRFTHVTGPIIEAVPDAE
jgi:hypothetical protein